MRRCFCLMEPVVRIITILLVRAKARFGIQLRIAYFQGIIIHDIFVLILHIKSKFYFFYDPRLRPGFGGQVIMPTLYQKPKSLAIESVDNPSLARK